jgi:hypothetical protein
VAAADEHDKSESDDNEPEVYKAEVGDNKAETQRENTRGDPTRMYKTDRIAQVAHLEMEQKELRCRVLSLSKIPCQYKALTGQAANPRRRSE